MTAFRRETARPSNSHAQLKSRMEQEIQDFRKKTKHHMLAMACVFVFMLFVVTKSCDLAAYKNSWGQGWTGDAFK